VHPEEDTGYNQVVHRRTQRSSQIFFVLFPEYKNTIGLIVLEILQQL
jgi:hypothetical protein